MPSSASNQFNWLTSGKNLGAVPQRMRYPGGKETPLAAVLASDMPDYITEQKEGYSSFVRKTLFRLHRAFQRQVTETSKIIAETRTAGEAIQEAAFIHQNVAWIDAMFGQLDKGYNTRERGDEKDNVEVVVGDEEQLVIEDLLLFLADLGRFLDPNSKAEIDIFGKLDHVLGTHELSQEHPCIIGLKDALHSASLEERCEGYKLFLQYIFETLYQHTIIRNERVVVHKEPFMHDGWSAYTVRSAASPDTIEEKFIRRKGVYIGTNGYLYKYSITYECATDAQEVGDVAKDPVAEVEVCDPAGRTIAFWEDIVLGDSQSLLRGDMTFEKRAKAEQELINIHIGV